MKRVQLFAFLFHDLVSLLEHAEYSSLFRKREADIEQLLDTLLAAPSTKQGNRLVPQDQVLDLRQLLLDLARLDNKLDGVKQANLLDAAVRDCVSLGAQLRAAAKRLAEA